MKVTREMISKDMRIQGLLFKTFVNLDSEKKFKRIQKIYQKAFKGKQIKNPNIRSSERMIPRRDGKEIRLCIHSSKNLDLTKPVTGLLWIHGGGYAIGLPEAENAIIEKLIMTSNAVVISPEYRLSVEAPFPAALDDCYDSLVWMKQHAEELGIRENQLFIGGVSAGGGLTCCVSAYARDKGEVNIAYQFPLYPMLDDRMQTNSMKNNNAPVWNLASNTAAWKLYLGKDYQSKDVSPYAAPARLTNYHQLPPTFTFLGDIEPFYDETMQYMEHLKNAGVPTTYKVYPGAFHAFDRIAPKSAEAKDAIESLLAAYQYAATNCFKEQKER